MGAADARASRRRRAREQKRREVRRGAHGDVARARVGVERDVQGGISMPRRRRGGAIGAGTRAFARRDASSARAVG